MSLIKTPLGPWQVMAIRIYAKWGRLVHKTALMEAYWHQAKLVRKALISSNLSSLVIRGYLTRTIFDNGEEWYQITPAGRELAGRLERAGS